MLARLTVLALLLPGLAQAGGLTAARTLPAGTVISASDLTDDDGASGGITDPSAAIGMQTRTIIYAGRPVLASHLRAAVLVERNQIVRLAFERGALRIEAEGRAMGEGAAGDMIRVMNIASRTTVTARVNPDGSVSVAN